MDKLCPLMKEACIEHRCRWYISVLMEDPQRAGAVKDQFGCAMEWIPMLLINNAKEIRDNGASIDGLRSEAGRGAGALIAHMLIGKPGPAQLARKDDETDRTG